MVKFWTRPFGGGFGAYLVPQVGRGGKPQFVPYNAPHLTRLATVRKDVASALVATGVVAGQRTDQGLHVGRVR
jgi:hypothetical protein